VVNALALCVQGLGLNHGPAKSDSARPNCHSFKFYASEVHVLPSRENLIRFGQIWLDLGEIWLDLDKFG